jgi:hypothetical protein
MSDQAYAGNGGESRVSKRVLAQEHIYRTVLLTGVRSLLSSSVAEAAASMRSSHRLPSMAAAACGSAEKALRS